MPFYLYGTGYIAGLRYPSSTMAPVGYDKRELDTSKCSALHTFRATRDLWLTLMLAGDFAPEHFRPATMHSAEDEHSAAARNTREIKTARRL